MKSGSSTYFKLGLFALLGLATAFVAAIALGARTVERETVLCHIFFDESVQGLDVGAPVKYRGVTMGHVEEIDIAPDHRHVDVVAELDVEATRRLGLTSHQEGVERFSVPVGLRAQLGMQGITGIKFVLIDFFDPATHPIPALPFRVPEASIPATASLLKNVEDRFFVAIESLSNVNQEIAEILKHINAVVSKIEREGAVDKILAIVDDVSLAIREARQLVRNVDRAGLPARVAGTLDKMDTALVQLDKTLVAVTGKDGLVESAKRASDRVGDLGRSTQDSTRDLANTLQDVGEAAQAVRRLADALERDPDMLLKGRARSEKP